MRQASPGLQEIATARGSGIEIAVVVAALVCALITAGYGFAVVLQGGVFNP